MKRILYGSGANIVRLAFITAVSVIIPPILTGLLSKGEYSTWVIVLQVSSYVGLLDIGLQTVVARFVAEHDSQGNGEQAAGTVSSAVVILSVCSVIGAAVVLLAVGTLPSWLPDIPEDLHSSAQLALLLVGLSSALTLPFGPFLAAFIGVQRYGFPTLLAMLSRAFSAALIIVGAHAQAGLVPIASALAFTNLATGATQYLFGRALIKRTMWKGHARPSRAVLALLLKNGGLLAVWTLSGVLVSSVDVLIVGRFDFINAGAFAIAASGVNFMTLAINSLFSPILPAAAAIQGKNSSQILAALTLRATRYCSLIILSLGGLLSIFAYPLLVIWVGSEYASSSVLLLQILVLGHGIRQLGYPYSLVVVARGKQVPVTVATVGEALVNVVTSVALASQFGAVGAAIGTVIGSIASIVLHLIVSMRATRATIPLPRRRVGLQGLLVPALATSPLLLVIPFYQANNLAPANLLLLAIILPLLTLTISFIGVERADLLLTGRMIISPVLESFSKGSSSK